jgi:signal transduction histidine kinase
MRSAPKTGKQTSPAFRFRTQLTLSNLLVGLVGSLLILVFAFIAIQQSLQQAAEKQMVIIATANSDALAVPLEQYLSGDDSGEYLQAIANKLWEETPNLHYTLYQRDGRAIIDSHKGATPTQEEISPEALQVLQSSGSPVIVKRINEQGKQALFVAVDVSLDGQSLGVLFLETPTEAIAPLTHRSLLGFSAFGLLVLIGISASGLLIARKQSAPLEHLDEAARKIASGDLKARAAIEGQSEIQNIAIALNLQSDRLQNSLNELRTFVASASHELRTPLTTVKLRAEALRSGALQDPKITDRFLSEIEDEIDRLGRMVNDLLDLSRIEVDMDTSKYTALNLGRIAIEVGDVFKTRADDCGIRMELIFDPELPSVQGNEEQIWRVLMNLIDNALNYTPSGGHIQVSVSSTSQSNAVRLVVQDNGPGISPEDQNRLFGRFFRTEVTRQRSSRSKGSGLGLAICKAIVENHGGKIGVNSKLGEGATFWVELPIN